MKKMFIGWTMIFIAVNFVNVACEPETKLKTALGTINGFGSIFVNGVEYNTDDAKVSMNGQVAKLSDLMPGMKVIVKGVANENDGIAISVQFEDELEGMIIANNAAMTKGFGTYNILGQTVTVTEDTVFASDMQTVLAPSALAVGMIVQVSGFTKGDGNITASFMHLKAPDLTTYLQNNPTGLALKGLVRNLDTQARSFYMGGQAIHYATANYSQMTELDLTNDLYVEVKSTAGLVAGQLQASVIEKENDGRIGYIGKPNEVFNVEGEVSGVATNTFTIDSQTIHIGGDTLFQSVPQTGLTVGVNLKVEGAFDEFGGVVASKVRVEPASDGRIRGYVSNINRTGTNTGTVTVDTLVYQVNNDTLMFDEGSKLNSNNTIGSTPPPVFNLQNVQVGNYVEISYYKDVTARRIALSLARDDSSPS